MSGPLEGLKIVEIGEGPALAYAGRNLADMGAEVVKVEPPEGDRIRRWPGPEIMGATAVFHALNRGKASIVLDVETPAGRRDFMLVTVVPISEPSWQSDKDYFGRYSEVVYRCFIDFGGGVPQDYDGAAVPPRQD